MKLLAVTIDAFDSDEVDRARTDFQSANALANIIDGFVCKTHGLHLLAIDDEATQRALETISHRNLVTMETIG